jgi:hypothetical protein
LGFASPSNPPQLPIHDLSSPSLGMSLSKANGNHILKTPKKLISTAIYSYNFTLLYTQYGGRGK